MYQQVNLSNHTLVGAPGPVPDRFAGLTNAQLADLGAFSDPPPPGYAGMGLWPVVVLPPSPFDPASHVAVDPDPSSYAADPASRSVVGRQTARAMTAAEYAVAHPAIIVTGNQWGLLLADLGNASAWLAGVAKSKAKDQVRVGLIARDTRLLADDPLLIRVAGNAGADGSGNPLVDVPTVFIHAQGMPT